jgi:hypothetical protein
MPTHFRKSSGGASQHTTQRRNSTSQTTPPKPPNPPKHSRTHTAPEPPTLLRLPSASSTTARRPPASHSGHGIDNSRGPPVTLVTRSRSSQNPADFAYAQQQFLHSSLVSPTSSHHSSRRRGDDEQGTSGPEAPRQAHQPPSAVDPASRSRPLLPRRASTSSSRPPPRRMASSTDESSDYESGPRSRMEDYHAAHSGRPAPAPATPGTDGEKEDLFLNIAADSAPKPPRPVESTARIDRLKVSASQCDYSVVVANDHSPEWPASTTGSRSHPPCSRPRRFRCSRAQSRQQRAGYPLALLWKPGRAAYDVHHSCLLPLDTSDLQIRLRLTQHGPATSPTKPLSAQYEGTRSSPHAISWLSSQAHPGDHLSPRYSRPRRVAPLSTPTDPRTCHTNPGRLKWRHRLRLVHAPTVPNHMALRVRPRLSGTS